MRSHFRALGHLYDFAGKWREVNISKGGFIFPAAQFMDSTMKEFEARIMRKEPKVPATAKALIAYLAILHGELLFIHPFREGNGRTARLLLDLLAMKHGYEKLDFEIFRKNYEKYVNAVHSAAGANYRPMYELISAAFPA